MLKTNTKMFFLTILISLLACSQIGNSAYIGDPSTVIHLGKFSITPYDYVIEPYNSTHIQSINASGYVYQSTNASAVIESLIAENKTLFFKEGNFAIDYLIPISVNNIHFICSGWGTQFTIGENGGFNLSAASALTDISFENIRWEGGGVALQMITSAMPVYTRIQHFVFSGNKVNAFTAVGCIALNLTNLEISTISNNMFCNTKTALIQIISNGFRCGNNKLYDNVFYFGSTVANENAIRLTAVNGNSTYLSSSGYIFSWGNQWFADTYELTAVAWNVTVTGTYCYGRAIFSSGDRYESIGTILSSTGYDATYIAGGSVFSNCEMYTNAADCVLFKLNIRTRDTTIHHNRIQMDGSNSSGLDDDYVSDIYPNSFKENTIENANMILNASAYTYVFGNTRFNPIGKITDWKAGSLISAYDGYASSFTNGTTYTVRTAPCYFTVSGGATVNVTITDPDGNQLLTGSTTLTNWYLPIGFKITCVFASSPSATCYFT